MNNYAPNGRYKLKVEFVSLIPDCINFYEFGDPDDDKKNFIPFSLSYFIQCYLRVKHRYDHPTLNGDTKNLMVIFGVFIKNFINVNLKNAILFQKIKKIIKLPFTDELEQDNFPKDLLMAANKFFTVLTTSTNDKISTPATESFEFLVNKYFPENKNFFSTKNLVTQTTEPIIAKLYDLDVIYSKDYSNILYLAIVFKNEENKVKIRSFIYKNINNFKSKFNIDNYEIKSLIKNVQKMDNNDLENNWKFPHKIHNNVWHTTLLYNKHYSNEEMKKQKEFQNFFLGKNCKSVLKGILYVPFKIITLLIINEKDVYSVNKYPHITGLFNEYAPKKSNEVIMSIMKNKEIEENYNKYFNLENNDKIDQDFYKEVEIDLEDDHLKVYCGFFCKNIILDGTMFSFEKN